MSNESSASVTELERPHTENDATRYPTILEFPPKEKGLFSFRTPQPERF